MNFLLIILYAASFAALNNLIFRFNSSKSTNINSYMSALYLFSFLLSLLFLNKEIEWNWTIVSIGMVVGVLNVCLMYLTALALKDGPSGAVFAFQNGAALFPGLILFLIFGPSYGYSLSQFQILGIILIVIGLYSFARNISPSPTLSIEVSASQVKNTPSYKWLPYALAAFSFQVLALTLIQWRCLLFSNCADHFLIPIRLPEATDSFFMPSFFATAFILQVSVLIYQKQSFNWREASYGLGGGIANSLSTFFLMMATKRALPNEQTFLFPLFAVIVIILCSAWAKLIYKEKFDLVSISFCASGILISQL